MPVEHLIPLENQSEWKNALKGIRHAFAHTWENCYAMYLTTGFPTYLYTFEADGVRIVCPISERTFDGYTDIVTPYGFSGFVGNKQFPEFPAYWDKFVKQKGYVCGYIGLNPVINYGINFGSDELYRHNNIYVLDLTLTTEELFRRCSHDRRYILRHWEENFSLITEEKPPLSKFFTSQYHDFFYRHDASHTYDLSNETLSFLLQQDNVKIIGVCNSEKILAVNVFAYTPYIGEALFNISLNEGRKYSSLLIWYGVKYLKSIGIPYLNLGGGVRENDSIAMYKERFGAMKMPLMCLKQVYEPHTYGKLCQKINADPNDRTGYFPPYHTP